MTEWVRLAGNNQDYDQPRNLTKAELNDIERKLNDKNDHWYFPAPPAADKESAELSRQNTIKFILVSLESTQLCPSAVNELLSRIIEAHHKRLISPGSPVGNTAAEAVGASTTQMTLNSVAPWEELLIQDGDGIGHTVKIGEWIDNLLNKHNDKIVHIPENRTQYLELEKPVKIVTSDNDGHVTWEDVTAVMRHLPVGDLVKITTRSGRQVTATQQKSFLIWDCMLGKLVETNGSDLKVGDLIPIANQIPDPIFDHYDKHNDIILDPIDKIKFVPATDYVYDLTVPSTLNFSLKNSLIVRDSFHQSGQQKSASFGIDAMRDIILARAKPKNESCTIYFRKQTITYEEVLNSRQYIVGSMIADFIADGGKKYEIKSPDQLERKWWHDEPGLFDDDLPNSKRVLRLHLNIVEMYKHRVTIEDLAQILKRKTFSPKREISSGIIPRYGPMEDAIIDLYPTAEIYKILEDVMDKFSTNVPQELAETAFLETIVHPELDKIRVKGLAGIKNLYPRVIPLWSMVLSERKLNKDEITKDTPNPKDTYVLFLNENVMRMHGFVAENLAYLCQTAGITVLARPDQHRVYIEMPADRFRTSKNQEVIKIENDQYIKLDKNSLKLFQNRYYEPMEDGTFIKDGDYYLLEVEKESSKINWVEEKIPAAIEVIPQDEVINLAGEYYRLVKNITDGFLQLWLPSSKVKINELKPGEYVAAKIAAAKRSYKSDVDRKTNEFLEKKEKVPIALPRPEILRVSELVIADTEGSNFKELLALRSVDKTRTTCNNMHTITETIGIEAARTFVIRQLKETIANTGSYIHPAHILFIAEFITSRGSPYGATYTGISKQPHGPLSLATVERAGKTFTQNALFGRKEDIRNVSASVAVGARMAVGNGMFDIAQDIIEDGKEVTLINDDVFDFSRRDDKAIAEQRERTEREEEEERNRLLTPIQDVENEIDALGSDIVTGYFPSNTGKINLSAIKAKNEETPKVLSTGLVSEVDFDVEEREPPPSLDDLFQQFQDRFIENPEYYSKEKLPTALIPISGTGNNLRQSLLAARQEQNKGLTFLG